MLGTLRKTASGVVAKGLLLMLVASFALWGIGDIFRGGAGSAVATVGGETITQQEYQQMLQRIQRNFSAHFPPEMLKQINLHDQLIGSLVNDALLVQAAEDMGLTLSTESMIKLIAKNPAFQSPSGNFDRSLFELTLRNNNQSEASFLVALEQEVVRGIIEKTLMSEIAPPPGLAEAIYKARNERRKLSLALISRSDLAATPTPSDKDLAAFHAQAEDRYMTDEYRTLSYLIIRPEDLAKEKPISEETLKALYEENKDQYRKPEHRSVQHMLFEKEEQVKAAHAQLEKGASFEETVKLAPIANKGSVDLGHVTTSSIPSGAEELVFSLKENTYSKPFQSAFGWHIFYVTRIEPEALQPFDDVKEQLTKEARGKLAEDSVMSLITELEDALAGGASLEAAAKQVGLEAQAVGPVSAASKTEDGKALDHPALASIIEQGFTLEEGEASPVVLGEDGVYTVVKVDAITPATKKPLEDVREHVIKDWTAKQQAKALEVLSVTLAEKHSGAKTLSQLVAGTGAKLQTLVNVTRSKDATFNVGGETVTLSGKLLEDALSQPEGGITQPHFVGDDILAIAQVDSISPAPAINAKNADQQRALGEIRQQLDANYRNELMAQYLTWLQQDYPVQINRDLIQQAAQE